jgi:uncharacterized delta-60 repeat protein
MRTRLALVVGLLVCYVGVASAALSYSGLSGPCAVVDASAGTFSSTGTRTCRVEASGAATANFVAASAQQDVTIATGAATVTAPGELDPTFSGDGKEIVDLGGWDHGYAVAIQADGKIVAVGSTYATDGTGHGDFALARYNDDGTLDTAFSDDGKQTTNFGWNAAAAGVALQADGKIVVVGCLAGGDFALARYNDDGTPDMGFSDDGKQTTDVGAWDCARAVAIQADGKIVVAGDASGDFALVRYNADGTLDTWFSGDGKVVTDLGGWDYGHAMAIGADGNIVIAGTSDALFALARYNVDGTLDTSFSDDGKQTTDFGASAYDASGDDVAIQPDGKIVVTGRAGEGLYYEDSYFLGNFALARYNADGTLDISFSDDGKQTTDFADDGASGVALQPDGKILVVGYAGGEFALARYKPDGMLDAGFSSDGRQTTHFGGYGAQAFDIALQPDGKILALGTTFGIDGGYDFALARYEGGLGASDTTFPQTTITGGPTGTVNDSTPTFTFDSSEGGSTFDCRVDDNTFSPCSSPYTTSTLSDGPHTFEVLATDAAGNADPSPASRGFTVDTAPVVVPGPTSPVSPVGSIATATPTFSWSAVSVAAYYALSITDANTAAAILTWYTPAQAGCASGVGACRVAAPRALLAGLVSWKVITWNPSGYGPWSSTATAVVDLADASVLSPVLLGPSGATATHTPSYTWTTVLGAIWYQLSVSVQDMFGLVTVREFWYTPAQACASSSCAVTPDVVLPTGWAQWKVKAWRTSGGGVWSAAVSFDTADVAPGKATLVSPVAPVTTTTPSFTWNAVLDTSYYLLRVTDRDNISVERWYRPGNAGCPVGTGLCAVSPGVSIKAGAASWKVLTWNASGYGPWSDTREFLIEIADPAALAPAPVSPTDAIVRTNVAYRWTAVMGAVSYRLTIRNNAGGLTYWWYTSAAADCNAAAGCSASPQVALFNGNAEWQVQAWTTIGYGPWSPSVALTVNIPAPPAPTLAFPMGATGTTSPAFRWDASANATLYYITAHDPAGLRVEKWLSPSQAGCASGGVCTFDAGITLASGAGSWKAIAWNPAGYSPWSSTLAFVVP